MKVNFPSFSFRIKYFKPPAIGDLRSRFKEKKIGEKESLVSLELHFESNRLVSKL